MRNSTAIPRTNCRICATIIVSVPPARQYFNFLPYIEGSQESYSSVTHSKILVCRASSCSSRTKNMMWYGVLGTKELVQKTYKNLEQRVQLEVRSTCESERAASGNQNAISCFFSQHRRPSLFLFSVTVFPCLCRVCRAWLCSTSPATRVASTSGEAPRRIM